MRPYTDAVGQGVVRQAKSFGHGKRIRDRQRHDRSDVARTAMRRGRAGSAGQVGRVSGGNPTDHKKRVKGFCGASRSSRAV